MKKTIYYAYADFLDDMKVLSARIEAGFGIPQAIVCIARGGEGVTRLNYYEY